MLFLECEEGAPKTRSLGNSHGTDRHSEIASSVVSGIGIRSSIHGVKNFMKIAKRGRKIVRVGSDLTEALAKDTGRW